MTGVWLWVVLPLGGVLAGAVLAWRWHQSRMEAQALAADLPDPGGDPQRPEPAAVLAEVLQTMPDGVVSVTRSGNIAFINPVAALLGGEQEREWVGRPLLHLLRSTALHQALEEVFEIGHQRTVMLEEYNPDLVVLRARISPVPTPGRAPMAVIVLENESELRHLQQVRLDFVHNASHELRTPIAHIMGAVEIVATQRSLLPEKVHSFLDMLKQESVRLKRITEDLLALASAERGSATANRPLDLCEVIRKVMDRDWSEKPFTVSTALPDSPVLVRFTWEGAQQVVGNLVDNACNYTQQGSVDVSLRVEDGNAVLRVSDTGMGIPATDQSRIFERFYRVDEHRSRQSGGTGLGLAIVKHIVENEGGKVSVKSTMGAGTSFTVRTPLATTSEPTAASVTALSDVTPPDETNPVW